MRVTEILRNDMLRRRFRMLEGDEAANALDLLLKVCNASGSQSVHDSHICRLNFQLTDMFPNDPDNYETHRSIRKLASHSGRIPRVLFLEDILCHEGDPLCGGGFADVWKGSRNGNAVAIKRLRIFKPWTGQKHKLIKVAHRTSCS
jgi:hypothetical protein